MGRECELKIALTEEGLARLHRALGPAERLVLQRNHYLDTPGGDLRRSHHGLRLRLEVPLPPAWLDPPEGAAQRVLLGLPAWADAPGAPLRVSRPISDPERYVLSLKGPTTRRGDWVDRRDDQVELTHVIAEAILARGAAVSDLPMPGLVDLAAELGFLRVDALGASDNLRRVYPVDLEGAAAHPTARARPPFLLEVDSTRYPGGVIEHEAELELPQGSVHPAAHAATVPPDASEVRAALQGLFARAGVPWTPGERGKYARFLERARLA